MDGYVRWLASEYDMASVLDIERQSFYYSLDKDGLTSILNNSSVVCAVYEQKNSDSVIDGPGLVTGYIIYRVHINSLYIISIAVLKDSRRLGIGTKLLDHVIKIAKHENMESIELKINETNLGAQLFFQRNDFKACTIIYDCTSRVNTSTEPLYGMVLDLWESQPAQ